MRALSGTCAIARFNCSYAAAQATYSSCLFFLDSSFVLCTCFCQLWMKVWGVTLKRRLLGTSWLRGSFSPNFQFFRSWNEKAKLSLRNWYFYIGGTSEFLAKHLLYKQGVFTHFYRRSSAQNLSICEWMIMRLTWSNAKQSFFSFEKLAKDVLITKNADTGEARNAKSDNFSSRQFRCPHSHSLSRLLF